MRRYFSNRFNRYNLIATIFLTVICLAWIYPFVWIFFASFKTQTAMFSDRWRLWPKPWVWDNYTRAWVAANFSKYFGNTLLYAVWSTAAGVTISAMCGYVLARYHFPGSRLLRIIILGLLFLPVPSTIIPTFQLVKALGLLNTRWGILLAMTGGGAFSTMLFMGAFDAIPQEMYDAAVVIPARLASSRFPRKVLADINGKPMIQLVYERSAIASVRAVYVATEDQEVVDVVHGFGGNAINTGPAPTVLHRCSLAASNEVLAHHEMIVVVQGDEPMVTEPMIRQVINQLGDADLNCSYRRMEDDEDPNNHNAVKVVLGNIGQEIAWASRSPIPAISPEGDYKDYRPIYHKQVCVMAFRTDVLARYRFLSMRNNEAAEGIDILRYLENGYRIRAVRSEQKIFCVDVPEDLERVKEWLPHVHP